MAEVEKRTVCRGKEPRKVLAVKKIGKTCITLEDGSKWRQRDGRPYGSCDWWQVETIREHRSGDEARIAYLDAIDDVVARISCVNWRSLPLMVLEKVLAIVEAEK